VAAAGAGLPGWYVGAWPVGSVPLPPHVEIDNGPLAAPSYRWLSVVGVILGDVEVSAEAMAKVPSENLRVSRADFGALWALAERAWVVSRRARR
jgi:hypothetical protein